MATSPEIAHRIVEAILAQKLAPGERLGEQPLADLFGVSRTLVREALTRLAARGIVTVTARRGWYVIEPSVAEAREALAAREIIETGLLRQLKSTPPEALKRLKGHVFRERQSIRDGDVGSRSYLLGDFHVCLAEAVGGSLLGELLRDLTARTTLISMLYQSSQSTGDGRLTITVTFKLGTDLDAAQVLVQNRVALAEPSLPEEVRRQGVVVRKTSPSWLMAVNVLSPDNSLDRSYVSNYALTQIKDRLTRVDGIGDVQVFGARDYAMRV